MFVLSFWLHVNPPSYPELRRPSAGHRFRVLHRDSAFASAGCHDNRLDKLWWNELWMGYSADVSYEDSSDVSHAHNLGGALMLAMGELDTNVDPSSTLRLAHAVIEADKDFDLVFVPGGTHHVIDMPFMVQKKHAFFRKHLQSY
ncbi:prolyl oligopeptidase family domain-containing protein [Hirsutella rhossiliensis]|uniref:Prolyl oligopeptidase family domain-containing protein n=1 Tax=Hirsutella rhossiliensis TaxID=111463 RepID=A0A9P8MU89_9HYPO|nr:prolyl oligopeptidase family domain-containing protein [Hirsutella rhossiliensis]KAH0962228.1 prolyl oligopeptidase family domain-containing protein [Hirsutella rhossiliensis]